MNLEIKPKIGLGDLKFGEIPEKVTKLLGEPEQAEEINSDDDLKTTLLTYKNGVTIFLEGLVEPVVSNFDIDNKKATLFGKNIFGMAEEEIVHLMSQNNFQKIEKEEEEWGETRLTFEDAMVDFYFEENELVAVSWGVIINEDGSVSKD